MNMKKVSEHRTGFFKRMLSMLLIIVLFVSSLGVGSIPASSAGDEMGDPVPEDSTAGPADEGTDSAAGATKISFKEYNDNGLDIYNHLYYLNASGSLQQSNGSYEITGENSAKTIVIGNHPTADLNTNPMDSDIPVFLNGLTMTQAVTIKQVGTANNGKVALTVIGAASSLGALEVEAGASLELVLNQNLTVDSITLGENSKLTVSGSGTLTVSGVFSGKGTVELNGVTLQVNQGLSVAELSLSGATVNASGKEVTATKTLSMNSGTVENASLFGYVEDEAESGPKTLTLTGSNTFTNIAAVGCKPESSSIVYINGTETVTSNSDSTWYRDYNITYQTGDGAISPDAGWPTAYRVSSGSASFDNATICGYHTATEYKKLEDPSAGVPLPDYSASGYEYQGWKLDASTDPVKAITTAQGDITLTAELTASAVTVTMDIGYDPDSYTNDLDGNGKLPERETVLVSEVGKTIDLPVPARFGYVFKGWQITSGSKRLIPYSSTGGTISYSPQQEDCAEEEGEDGEKTVTMEAEWEKDTFGLTLYLPNVPWDQIRISVDGGHKFLTLAKLGEGYSGKLTLDQSGSNIRFPRDGNPITYGQKISDYLRKTFTDLPENTLPVLQDARIAGSDGDAKQFAGWANNTGAVDENTTFSYGPGGMLAPMKNQTLKDYQSSLIAKNAAVDAAWGGLTYGLTVRTKDGKMPEGWTLTYTDGDGVEHEMKAGESIPSEAFKVQQDSKVTFTTIAVEDKENGGGNYMPEQNFSLWGFTAASGGSITPAEQPYKRGDPSFKYEFTMPAANVTASHGLGDAWIDIARSPIEFQETVSYNNHFTKGFWYADTVEGLTPLFWKADKTLPGTRKDGTTVLPAGTWFYQWNFQNDKLCVTSNNVETKNQLTLVNELKQGVHFKQLNLVMRDAYVNKTGGSLIDGVDCEKTNDGPVTGIGAISLGDYANIIVDNSKILSYNTKLYFEGRDNTVGAVMPATLRENDENKSELAIEGGGKDESALKLGTAFGNFSYSVKNISVSAYEKANKEQDLKYLFHASNRGCTVIDAEIKAKDKTIHVGNSSFYFATSKLELLSINAYAGGTVKNSYLRIRDNLLLGYIRMRLEEGAKVVIDGNLEVNYQHWSSKETMTDGTDNWLVVKGNRCDLSNFTWCGGTLVCNALIFGRCGGVTGGKVVTNQILSQPVGFWKYDNKTHTYNHDSTNNYTEEAKSNEDNYPFPVYAQRSDGIDTYQFGGEIYLLGHYKTKVDGSYDERVTALDTDNPVEQFMAPLLDQNGDLVGNPSVNSTEVKDAVEKSANTDKECVVLSSSTYNTGTRSRTVEISEGAKICAAGNVTFHNDTVVSGGSVSCNGSFGTKGDLTVKGGTITATTVGNAYQIKTELEDGTFRWRRTDIQGGTINANQIGAFAAYGKKGLEPRSTVSIGAGANIVGKPPIVHDVYINYILGSQEFSKPAGNPETLRFRTYWEQSKGFANLSWSNTEVKFIPPELGGGDEPTNWRWDSLTGGEVTKIDAEGFADEGLANRSAFDRIQMKLYAAKVWYELIFEKGAAEVVSATSDGKPLENPKQDGDRRKAMAGRPVQLIFKEDPAKDVAKDYTVLWYVDGSGLIHNVPFEASDGKLTFTMPSANVQVYRTDTMELDLDTASYTLNGDGFWTESGETPERKDSVFHYWGDLVIQQGSIDTIKIRSNQSLLVTNRAGDKNDPSNRYDNSSAINDYDKKVGTYHDIRVKGDFDNSENGGAKGRKVTLHHIYQLGESYTTGIHLEERANANFTLDGPIKICRVHVPDGAAFGLTGTDELSNKDEPNAFFPYVVGDGDNRNKVCLGNGDQTMGTDGKPKETGKAGDITLRNLKILATSNGMRGYFCYGGVKGTNKVRFEKCEYQNQHWYSSSYLAYNAEEVSISGGNITIARADNWPSPFFENCDNVTVNEGARIIITESGSTRGPTRPFYAGIREKLLIKDANVALYMREPTENGYRMAQDVQNIAQVVELTGSASLTLDQHARLKRLVLNENSTVNAGDGKGYLLCPDIAVNGGTLNAGGIIVSGFYDAGHVDKDHLDNEKKTEQEFLAEMVNGRYIYDGNGGKTGSLTYGDTPGLVVNGGTVTADYVTGDVNGKVTVNGGTVEAGIVGTTGKLYGYAHHVPTKDEQDKYIYTYSKIPAKNAMTVNVSGGEVRVSEYLGGMHAAVNVSGGTVTLGEDAVLGLTEEQQSLLVDDATSKGQTPADFGTLKVTGGTVTGSVAAEGGTVTKGGSIRMPYGMMEVSGADTAINVYDMTAERGEIKISEAQGTYENPYGKPLDSGRKVGVYVTGKLWAKNLTIDREAVVYADYAYIDVPEKEEGKLTVEKDGKIAYLYTGTAYGEVGEGTGSRDYYDESADNQNVFETRMEPVRYVLHPTGEGIVDEFLTDDLGKEINPNWDRKEEDGVFFYVVGTDNCGEPETASCDGYDFLGWYEYDPDNDVFLSEEPFTGDVKDKMGPIYLGAKWKKVKVQFEIRIEIEESEFESAWMELIQQGTNGKNLYRFIDEKSKAPVHVDLDYGERILGTNAVNRDEYTTKTKGALGFTYEGTPITNNDNNENSRVTVEMVNTFLKGGRKPLVLMVQDTQIIRSLITLNLNRQDKHKDNVLRPLDAKFNLSEGKIEKGGDEQGFVYAYMEKEKPLGAIEAFAKSGTDDNPDEWDDGLIDPTAPGYTFGGWYTDKECTGDRVSSTFTIENLTSTTLYAKWTPNIYLVRFSAETEPDPAEKYGKSQWVTSDETPAVNAQSIEKLDYYWVYDTRPETEEGDCFWMMGEWQAQKKLPKAWREGFVFEGWHDKDSDKILTAEELLNELEISALDVENYAENNQESIDDIKNHYNEETAAPALTLYAKYHPVEVEYDVNEGKWTADEPTKNPAYGTALAAYTKESDINTGLKVNVDYAPNGTDTGADGETEYSALSTTKGYFEAKIDDGVTDYADAYVPGDYRKTLYRKGYTFQGWQKVTETVTEEGTTETIDTTKYYGCAPRFEDLKVKAKWTPNTYDLILHVKDKTYGDYVSCFNEPNPDTVTIPNVEVDGKIESDEWPERKKDTEWYAYNPDEENEHRIILGATFAALDPGDSSKTETGSIYLCYAEAVTKMQNSKTMFYNGDTFFLPEDEDYQQDLGRATVARPMMSSVPDYPDGSTIPLYGLYRERSLVFIEDYLDEEGMERRQVMYTHPWREYTNYPYEAYKEQDSYKELKKKGYRLHGWYVFESTIDDARKYPEPKGGEEVFAQKIDNWKEIAEKKGEYDINVYTVYLPNTVVENTLTASQDPKPKEPEKLPSLSYTLPGSMQEGAFSYEVTGKPDSLHLVDKAEIEAHQYDSEWTKDGVTYSADDTVAIELILKNRLGAVYQSVDLKQDGPHPLKDNQPVSGGWTLMLRLYHSRVMTQNRTYPVTIMYRFDKKSESDENINVLENQWVKYTANVVLQPSLYDVTYNVTLPESVDNWTDANEFTLSEDGKTYSLTAKCDYGGPLLTAAKSPELAGYKRDTEWSYAYHNGTDDKTAKLASLKLDEVYRMSNGFGSDEAASTAKVEELKDGAITLFAGYTIGRYKLKRDDTVLDDAWTITYSEAEETKEIQRGGEAEVKYHSVVTLKPGTIKNLNLTLSYKDDKGEATCESLERLVGAKKITKQDDGSYTFNMPAKDVTVSALWDLYLDNGTIELFPEYFMQEKRYGEGAKIPWKGGYRILQCEDNNSDFHTTENVLKLYGDLLKRLDNNDAREIRLYTLNITTPNSIELIDENGALANVKLTQKGKIAAKNILVPEKTTLTLVGAVASGEEKSITLAPDKNCAAIGAAAGSPANGSINLEDVDVSMTLADGTVSSGIGSGKQDSSVDVSYGGVTVTRGAIHVTEGKGASGAWVGGAGVSGVRMSGTVMTGKGASKAVDGFTVSLTGCTIGADKDPIGAAIHALNSLKIEGGSIYQ